MSFLARLWQRIRSPMRYVGRDIEGNRFYEHPSSSSDPRRTKRTVQYHDSEAIWQYVGGGKRLPVQWSAWMTHTRHHPPTLQELQMDLARQQRVLANVALIESREQEEHVQLRLLNAAPSTPVANDSTPGANSPSSDEPPASSQSPSLDTQSQTSSRREESQIPPSSDSHAPQSWAPRTRRRDSQG